MRLLRYLGNDLIDLYLLCLFIILVIKFSIDQVNLYAIGGASFAILYILGVMWRMGTAKDIMNEFIKDDNDRRLFGMNSYATRNFPIRKGAFAYIIILAMVIVTAFGLFELI